MNSPFLSIVIPVYNGGKDLVSCLASIKASSFRNWELIVVDDQSTDASQEVALSFGATVLSTGGRRGPGAARNLGAQQASGEFLIFIDADCQVLPDTLDRMAAVLRDQPDADAAFGSYDSNPADRGFISQYKNLSHRYLHQTSRTDASTFWAGCGAIRRQLFLVMGGFDTTTYPRPMIEDIDLGYRIRKKGGKILLAKQVEVKHHKKWTFLALLKADVCDRGIPWVRLILSDRTSLVDELNLQWSARVSVVTACLVAVAVAVWPGCPYTLLAVSFLLMILVYLNYDCYRFFLRCRGPVFTLGAFFMHWIYFLCCGISIVYGGLLHIGNRIINKDSRRILPLPLKEQAVSSSPLALTAIRDGAGK